MKDSRYEEALERARAGMPIDEVFPELKESEDERIIEELIGHCKDLVRMNQDDKVIVSVYEPWLVWLEKQKEQKLAEWSEEDELMRKRCIVDLGYLTEYEPQYKGRYDAQIEWLKSLFERFNCQPKQEWSEDDERMFNSLCTVLHGGLSSIPTEQFISWLKSIRPQPKEELEPMEIKYGGKIYKVHGVRALPGGGTGYIIEDEHGHYDCIMNPEEVLGGGYGVKQNGSPYPTKEATFDSPHWKPSEEQIGALNYAYCELFKRKDVEHNILGPLQKLIDELQKLL